MSGELVTGVTQQVEEAKAAVAPIVERAHALTVTNFEEHQAGLRMLVDVMAAERRVKAIFAPSIEAAMEAKRAADAARARIVELRDNVMASVTEAREAISATCRDFEMEERRVARLNQERIDAEARAAQEEQRLLDSAMAETPEQAEEILEEPLPPPRTPTVKPDVAKVAGVTTRETWTYEIIDKPKFLEWAAKPENNFYALDNAVALNSRARAEKEKLSIPGVRAVPKLSHAAK